MATGPPCTQAQKYKEIHSRGQRWHHHTCQNKNVKGWKSVGNTGIWLILKSDKCIIQLNLVSFMLIELALKIARLLLAGRLKGSFFFFFLDSLNPYLWALYTTLLQTLLQDEIFSHICTDVLQSMEKTRNVSARPANGDIA